MPHMGSPAQNKIFNAMNYGGTQKKVYDAEESQKDPNKKYSSIVLFFPLKIKKLGYFFNYYGL